MICSGNMHTNYRILLDKTFEINILVLQMHAYKFLYMPQFFKIQNKS